MKKITKVTKLLLCTLAIALAVTVASNLSGAQGAVVAGIDPPGGYPSPTSTIIDPPGGSPTL